MKNLQTDNQKLRDVSKQERDKCKKNLKIQVQAEHEKCNKPEQEIRSLKHEYENVQKNIN